MVLQPLTVHEAYFAALSLFNFGCIAINSAFLAMHLRDHRRWREREEGIRRQIG